MAEEADDDAELLAALNEYGAINGDSNSDSDDDSAVAVDTSAVAAILARRHGNGAVDFSVLADELQTCVVLDDRSHSLDEQDLGDLKVIQ
jgi:hypothetical protein